MKQEFKDDIIMQSIEANLEDMKMEDENFEHVMEQTIALLKGWA